MNELTKIEMFGCEILHLISIGCKENISDLEKNKEQIATYILNKYQEKALFQLTDFEMYSLPQWDKLLSEKAFFDFEHDITRKMGIANRDDGLLVLLSIIFKILS